MWRRRPLSCSRRSLRSLAVGFAAVSVVCRLTSSASPVVRKQHFEVVFFSPAIQLSYGYALTAKKHAQYFAQITFLHYFFVFYIILLDLSTK